LPQFLPQLLAASLGALVLGSCATKPQMASAPTFPPCDTVSSTATTTSRGTSLFYAQRSLARLYPDARGDLLGVGYRRIRVVGRDQSCQPYRIGGLNTGLITCSVRARICGK
jgi:hypothetical protein